MVSNETTLLNLEVLTLEFIIILAIVAVVAVLLYLVWRAKSNWKPICEDKGGISDEVAEQYSHLMNEGIKCRLKHISTGNAGGPIGSSSLHSQEKVRIEVHKKDFERATHLLEQFKPTKEFKI